MKLRITLACLLGLLMAQAAPAVLKAYSVNGDQSTFFPTDGTLNRPGTVSGSIEIDDDGTPDLTVMDLTLAWTDVVGGTVTCCAGTTVALDALGVLGPTSLPDAGTGSTAPGGSVSFGTLDGWTQTGRLVCTVFAGAGCPGCTDSCTLFVGFVGTGPPPPLNASSYTLDPFTFTGTGSGLASLDSTPFQNVTLGTPPTEVTQHLHIQASQTTPVPTVGALGTGVLVLGALGFGLRKLRATR